MPAIYEGRGSLINEGLLRQYSAAKGGILDPAIQALTQIPEKRAMLQRQADEHKNRVLENEKLMNELTPENIAATAAFKRAQLTKANQDITIGAEQIQQQTEADAAEHALAPITASSFNVAMPDPMAVADATVKIQSDPKLSGNPQIQKNLTMKQASITKAAEGKVYKWIPGDGSAPSIVDFSQAASRHIADIKRKASDPAYVPGQSQELSMSEVQVMQQQQKDADNARKLVLAQAKIQGAKDVANIAHQLDPIKAAADIMRANASESRANNPKSNLPGWMRPYIAPSMAGGGGGTAETTPSPTPDTSAADAAAQDIIDSIDTGDTPGAASDTSPQ